MEAFRRVASAAFEEEMVAHLVRFAAWDCQRLGETPVREVIRQGCRRAHACGFTTRGPVRLFLELMFMFGCAFDTDPQLIWAGRALEGRVVMREGTRATRLHGEAMAYIHDVLGPRREHSIAAQRCIRASLEKLPELRNHGEEALVGRLGHLYPTKFDYVGEFRIRDLIRNGVQDARRRSLGTPVGEALFVTLTFALGHGFADDPLHPWVQGILQDQARDTDTRVERLRVRAVGYLEEATS